MDAEAPSPPDDTVQSEPSEPESNDLLDSVRLLYTREAEAQLTYDVWAELALLCGYSKLAAHWLHEADEEREHTRLCLRMLRRLDVVPAGAANLEFPDNVPSDPIEMITHSELMERKTLDTAHVALAQLYETPVHASTNYEWVLIRPELEELARGSLAHLEWARSQLHLVEQLGRETFLSTWI